MRKRIVLAEDNPGDVHLVREALHATGLDFELLIYRDVPEALDAISALEAGPPDGVLLDLNMVRGDGIAVLKRFRESPMLHAVPVTILSSSQSPRDREAAFALGADDFLAKPTMLDEFLTAVSGAVLRMVNRPAA